MISMWVWGREINSAEAEAGAVARIGGVIFKAVIMMRKRWGDAQPHNSTYTASPVPVS
jgi:hypothetical protein